MPKGRFIVLEGLDGAGITTQTEFLRTWCEQRGIPVAVTKEPSEGPAGGVIKQALRHRLGGLSPESMALLFAADRQDHVACEIAPALASGTTVVCDRYYLSSFAYQLVEIDDLEWLRQINSKCPAPDLTIYLDVPAEACLDRMKTDVWRGADQLQLYEEIGRLRQVRTNFLHVIPILRADGHKIVIVDGTQQMTAVAGDVLAAVGQVLAPPKQPRRGSRRDSGSSQIAAILQREPAAG